MTDADPRREALDLLNDLDRGKMTLDRLVSERFAAGVNPMSARDVNLAYALIYGVLRWRGRIDWIIGRFSKDSIEKIDPVILNILRMGLFQIFHMDRIPESAAVNTSVELAKKSAPPWVVKFVNGLLRNVIRNKEKIEWPDANAVPLRRIAVDHSFPQWLVKRWVKRFGTEETISLCRFLNTIAPLTLRTNTLKISRENMLGMLQASAETVHSAVYAPEGILLERVKCQVADLPGFSEGYFQIQDEAAQLVARVVAPRPGEAVLDACAGLGGKTAHIAQMMDNSGRVTAMDKDDWKLDALESEMHRLGITTVSTETRDLNQKIDLSDNQLYDRVLVDAPCSGLGVIRRNPDTKWSADPGAFARYRDTQLQFLDHSSQVVRPGGTLVYAVCSMAPEETDEVISSFMQTHPDFIIKQPSGADFLEPLLDERGCVRSYPHIHHMDGFFIAHMKRLP